VLACKVLLPLPYSILSLPSIGKKASKTVSAKASPKVLKKVSQKVSGKKVSEKVSRSAPKKKASHEDVQESLGTEEGS
jgi:hypothetical protein